MNDQYTAPRAKTAYGLDENGGSPILVKALRRGRSLSFTRVSPTDYVPAPHTVLAACLHQRESFIRWLTAPIASPRKAETVFHSLLDVQLPFSVEDCEVALLATVPTSDRTGTRGLVAGARREDVERKLSALTVAGFDPHLLDQESIALWHQGLQELPPEPGEKSSRVVVYLGTDRVTLVAGTGGEFGGAQSMRQAEPEAIYRFLKSVFPDAPGPIQWLWTGPAAALGNVESLYATLSGRWPGSTKLVREPETFLARSLAGRALVSGPTGCNLRSGRLLHPVLARHLRRQPFIRATACLAAGILLCLVNIVWLAAVQHRISGAQATLRELASAVIGSTRVPKGQEVLTARRALEQQTKDMEPFLAALDAPLPGTLSTILALATEEGVTLETLTLNRKNGAIHGVAPKFEQAGKLAQRLKGTGWTASLERKESPMGEDRAAFVIGMERNHGQK